MERLFVDLNLTCRQSTDDQNREMFVYASQCLGALPQEKLRLLHQEEQKREQRRISPYRVIAKIIGDMQEASGEVTQGRWPVAANAEPEASNNVPEEEHRQSDPRSSGKRRLTKPFNSNSSQNPHPAETLLIENRGRDTAVDLRPKEATSVRGGDSGVRLRPRTGCSPLTYVT